MSASLALIAGCGAAGAGGQVNVDSLRRAQQAQVDQHRAEVAAAAVTFLDRTRSANDRLSAVRQITGLLEPQHVDGGKRTVLDRGEPAVVRVRALQLVGDRVLEDSSFAKRVAGLVTDTTAPAALRSEAVLQLAQVSFAMHDQPVEYVQALRAGARHPDVQVRRAAFRALAGHGDQVVLRMLEAGLDSPATALLPPSEAVSLLGLNNPAPFYPLLSRLMGEPPDSATRVAAIRLLASHAPSRGPIAAILRDRRDGAAARHAALGALAAGDPRGLPQQVLPVVADEAEPPDLRIRAIKAVEATRTSRDPEVFGRSPDEFDRLMERLAASSPTAAVQQAAREYLSRTRSAR